MSYSVDMVPRRPLDPRQTSAEPLLDVTFDGYGAWTSFRPSSDVCWTLTRRHVLWKLVNSQSPIFSNFWSELFKNIHGYSWGLKIKEKILLIGFPATQIVYHLSWWRTNQWNSPFNLGHQLNFCRSFYKERRSLLILVWRKNNIWEITLYYFKQNISTIYNKYIKLFYATPKDLLAQFSLFRMFKVAYKKLGKIESAMPTTFWYPIFSVWQSISCKNFIQRL